MVNPFDLKTILLAKHAQYVVLIHFPIALFISAVAFDLISQWTRREGLADAAYYNLVVASRRTTSPQGQTQRSKSIISVLGRRRSRHRSELQLRGLTVMI